MYSHKSTTLEARGAQTEQGTEPPMGTGDGDDPRSPANRGWRRGWTPDPRQIGDGVGNLNGPPIMIPGKSGMAVGMGIGGSVP
jgi:hypothetical protein